MVGQVQELSLSGATRWRMAQEVCVTALEFRFGRTGPSTRASGETIRPTGRALFGTPMATSTKVTGKMIKRTAMDFTSTLMEQNI